MRRITHLLQSSAPPRREHRAIDTYLHMYLRDTDTSQHAHRVSIYSVASGHALTNRRDWSASATTIKESHPSSDAPSCVISRGNSVAFDR